MLESRILLSVDVAALLHLIDLVEKMPVLGVCFVKLLLEAVLLISSDVPPLLHLPQLHVLLLDLVLELGDDGLGLLVLSQLFIVLFKFLDVLRFAVIFLS